MKLSALIAPDALGEDPDVTGLTADSRAVRPGYLFAALPGVRHDGRAFIPQAVEAGAVAVLSPPDVVVSGAAHIVDDNPRRRLAHIAARFHPRQPETLVAVTGTNGKSSTVDFVRQIWVHEGRRAASVGTLGVSAGTTRTALGLTTPDPVALHQTLDALAEEGVSHAAMEASSHGLAQHRLDVVRLTAAGFTNLTQDHLDYHGSFEAYFAAKMRLFEELLPVGAGAVVNVDSDWGRRAATAARKRGLSVTETGWRGGDVKLCELTPRPTSQALRVQWGGEELDFVLPLVGEFQALNALAAAALAVAAGTDRAVAIEALGGLDGVRGRLELAGTTAAGAPVFVDYAHTPDGLDKLLRALRPHTQNRIVLVFGAGGERDPSKRTPMGEIAARHADIAIVTDDNPRSEDPAAIRAAVLAGCPGALEIADRREAIARGASFLASGDALVIAGKGHETGQTFSDRVVPFDDVEEARAALTACEAGG